MKPANMTMCAQLGSAAAPHALLAQAVDQHAAGSRFPPSGELLEVAVDQRDGVRSASPGRHSRNRRQTP